MSERIQHPPVTTKIEIQVVHQPDPRNGRTLGKAYAARNSEVTQNLAKLLDAAIAAHGLDAAAWSDAVLDELVVAESRLRALELLRSHARRRHIEWETTPAPLTAKQEDTNP